jgi:hypothetical protein
VFGVKPSETLEKHFNVHLGQHTCPLITASLKVKVKFSLERAMKAQRGSRGIALLFL